MAIGIPHGVAAMARGVQIIDVSLTRYDIGRRQDIGSRQPENPFHARRDAARGVSEAFMGMSQAAFAQKIWL